MLGSAVIAQALLSAANLAVGLILIRRTTDGDYGAYVLVFNALLLITQLQTQFLGPAMVARMVGSGIAERASLIGRLYQVQKRLLPLFSIVAGAGTILLYLAKVLTFSTACVVIATIATAMPALHREFFRMVLLAYRLPTAVLKGDGLYVLILVGGAWLSTFTPYPTVTVVIMLGLAGVCGGSVMSRALWRKEPWSRESPGAILREIAVIGAWTTASSAIYWTFTQGYSYLIVGALDVKSVAAVAATRLLMMPVNMVSTGVGSLMLPTTSSWLRQHGARTVFLRLLLLSGALALAAGCYFGLLWELRDAIFADILKKQFAQRDLLMSLWFAIFLLMIFRDQLLFLPLARGRYRILTGLTFVSALTSLTVGYVTIARIGAQGALIGVLTGETLSVCGLIIMSIIEMRKRTPALDTPIGASAVGNT